MEQLLTPEQHRQIGRLKFPQPLEALFWMDWANKIRRPVRIIAIAGLVLCVLFIVATIFVSSTAQGRTSNFWSVAAVVPILVVTLLLTRTRVWPRVNPFTLWIVIAAMALANGYSLYAMKQNDYERAIIGDWMFFSVIVIGSGLALLRSAAVAMAIVLGSYLYLSFGLRDLTEPARTSNLMVMGQTVLFALAASYVAEVRARREFLLGHLLDEERKKTEGLLYNVLPDQIADRLKTNPGVLAERHDDASVLFADLVGFTPYASSRDAKEVVSFLDNMFSQFDDLVEQCGLEKIKTIGDAYMVAGGVLRSLPDHLESMADLALDMQIVAKQVGTEMRIGIHCGPLVAGVIGRKKYLYDLWGETVNTASRMESHGLPNRIQVSGTVATRLQPAFTLEERGIVDVKGVGPMETYFLLARRGAEVADPPEVLSTT